MLQLHGLDVSIINAVRYSNHTAYGQCTGSKTTREEVAELYRGLKQSGLDDFGILVSGYCPSADIVLEVGCIAREKRDAACAADEPGSFFWGKFSLDNFYSFFYVYALFCILPLLLCTVFGFAIV